MDDFNEIETDGNLQNNKIKRNIEKNSFIFPQILSVSVQNQNEKQINNIRNIFNSEIKFNSLQINQEDSILYKAENNKKGNKKKWKKMKQKAKLK